MKIKIILCIIAIIFAVVPYYLLSKYKKENKRLTNNQETLLFDKEQFKINDSLNAIRVSKLELSISEFKKYKAEDAKLIKDLKLSKSQLQGIISINAETINNLKLALRDSFRIDTITNTIDTLKCFDYNTKWIDINGCFSKDTIQINCRNRESLKAIESLQKKKIWFIKLPIWLFGYKNKQLTILSNNPATTITDVEFISIKK